VTPEKHIFRIIQYDPERGAFFYKVEEGSPERGPFRSNAEALGDREFHSGRGET
jgi:hypothetical protein